MAQGSTTGGVGPRVNTFAYDAAGQRTSLGWPGGFHVGYDHLLTGEVSKVRENGAISGFGVLAAYEYDDLGNRRTLTRGNGTTISDALRLNADAMVSYQSKTQADSAGIPPFAIDDHALVNGSIGLAGGDDSWRVSLYGRNLFDKYYRTGVSSGTETVFRFPGMPRELGVRAAFRF